VGDVIGVMHRGHLEQWDDAYTLYHRPASRFVAQFIGHGVFAPAQIVACAHGPLCAHAGGRTGRRGRCPLPGAYPDGECDVLLRADDIVHDDAAPVRACIERKAFRGSEFLYTLRLASGEQVLAHVPSAPRPPGGRMDRHPRPGGPRGDLSARTCWPVAAQPANP
jgi:iron(III) transport system ATP-binding protein